MTSSPIIKVSSKITFPLNTILPFQPSSNPRNSLVSYNRRSLLTYASSSLPLILILLLFPSSPPPPASASISVSKEPGIDTA